MSAPPLPPPRSVQPLNGDSSTLSGSAERPLLAIDHLDGATLTWLTSLTARLSEVATLDALVEVIGHVVSSLTRAEFPGLYLIDPDTAALRLVYSPGLSEEERVEAERTAGDRHPGLVIRTRQPYRVDDTGQTPPQELSVRRVAVRSRVWLPVMWRDECVGAFGLASSQPSAFSELDLQRIGLVCSLTAIAYQRIVGELRRRQSEERAARAESEARASARAAELQEQFLAMVSHELLTPLHAVLSFGKLLTETPLVDRQAHYVDKILSEGQSLSRLLRDLLLYVRLGQSELAFEHVEFDLESLVGDVLAPLAAQTESKGVALTVELDPRLPERIWSDPLRVRQLLGNLVGNAVKFTATGEIAVKLGLCRRVLPDSPSPPWKERSPSRAPESTAAFPPRQLCWGFEVRDTGIGMTDEQVAQVFAPFVQADRSMTRRYGGSGLGLSICQRLVERMGGTLTCSSTLGVGSVFTCTIPLEATAAPPLVEGSFDGLHLLAVTSQTCSRSAVRRIVEPHGVELSEAASLFEALSHLARGQATGVSVDAVLLDRELARESGRELDELCALLAALRAQQSSSRTTPFRSPRPALVVFSADPVEALPSSLPSSIGELLTAPLVPKPLLPRALLAALRTVEHTTAHERQASPPTPTSSPQGLAGLRVLVVDDSEINREIVRELLRMFNIDPLMASNGAEALELLERLTPETIPEVVLMDLEMPVLDGLSATREIRKRPAWRTLPILAMTAHEGSRALAEAAGMTGHLSKPVDPDLLRTLLADVKARSPELSGPPHFPAEEPPPLARAAPSDEPLPARFDLDALLLRLGGQEEVAHRLLRSYLDRRAELEAQLDALRQSLDVDGVVSFAHLQKGVASSMGLDRLAQDAAHLERLARHGAAAAEVRRALDALSTELGATCAELEARLVLRGAPASATGGECTADEVTVQLRALHDLVERSDFEALDAFARIHPELRRLHSEALATVDALSQALERFDFSRALELVEELLQNP